MGLDITAYKGLTKLNCVFDSDGEPLDADTHAPVEDYFRAYINPSFTIQQEGITDGAVYSFEDSDGFRAGSYGGYNSWRDTLARVAGYPLAEREQYRVKVSRHDAGAWDAESGPFHELINFSDCEGVIGPVVSKKLAADFAEYQAKADQEPDERWRNLYASWREAFEMAAQNGAVSFH